MRRPLRHTLRFLVLATLACTSGTEPALPSLPADPSLDVDAAFARWTATHPASYAFEAMTQESIAPSVGFIRFEVTNGHVTSAHRVSGDGPVREREIFTIDELWTRLRNAKMQGTKPFTATFSTQGVPVDVSYGDFAVDGGVHYAVRGFEARP